MKKLVVSLSIILGVSVLSSFIVPNSFTTTDNQDSGVALIQVPYNNMGVLCNEEFLILRGIWKFESAVDKNVNGGFHVEVECNLKASEKGDLDNEYKLEYNKTLTFDVLADDLPYVFSKNVALNIIGAKGGPDLRDQAKYYINIDGNGHISVKVENGELVCKKKMSL